MLLHYILSQFIKIEHQKMKYWCSVSNTNILNYHTKYSTIMMIVYVLFMKRLQVKSLRTKENHA